MSCVSLLIPFVVAYIAYAWHQMDKKKITAEEIEPTQHKY
jgi:cytochrome d ubiquinol oxidase subunit II